MKPVTAAALSRHLFCTRDTIFDYAAKGVIEKLKSGQYDLDDCRKRVLKHLRDRSAGRSGGQSGIDLSAEKALLAKEQRETAALKNQMTRGELVSIKIVADVVGHDYTVIREKLLTIPGKLADGLAMRTREEIEPTLMDEITETLNELHDPKSYDYGSRGPDLGGAGADEDSQGTAQADGDRVGRPIPKRIGEKLGKPGAVEN